MYLGETLAGIIGGILFAKFSGFMGISIFTSVIMFLSFLIYSDTKAFDEVVSFEKRK